MRNFILGLVLLVGSSALASDISVFAGKWSGEGTYILNGVMTNCATFELGFTVNDSIFTFSSGSRSCELHDEVFPPVSMIHRDGKLFYGTQQVGSFTSNTLEASFSLPEGDGRIRHWRMFMRKEGDHLMYEESRTMDDNETPMISFAGLLIKEKE